MADRSASYTAERDKGGYWAANVRIIFINLFIWAIVSLGFGVVLRPMLAGISVGGTDLGFWFAQQGAILVFILQIFFYSAYMNRLDRQHGVDEV